MREKERGEETERTRPWALSLKVSLAFSPKDFNSFRPVSKVSQSQCFTSSFYQTEPLILVLSAFIFSPALFQPMPTIEKGEAGILIPFIVYHLPHSLRLPEFTFPLSRFPWINEQTCNMHRKRRRNVNSCFSLGARISGPLPLPKNF